MNRTHAPGYEPAPLDEDALQLEVEKLGWIYCGLAGGSTLIQSEKVLPNGTRDRQTTAREDSVRGHLRALKRRDEQLAQTPEAPAPVHVFEGLQADVRPAHGRSHADVVAEVQARRQQTWEANRLEELRREGGQR